MTPNLVMRRLFILVFIGLLFLSGCTQTVEKMSSQLSNCTKKCGEICDVLLNNSVNFEGYNQIQIEKTEGSLTTYCGCRCAS